MNEPIWKPTADQVESANMTAFMRHVRQEYGANVDDYAALWRWSVDRREEFWPAVWQFCGVRASRLWDRVLVDGDKMPGAQWFPGARLNFAENLLKFSGDEPAVIAWNEEGFQKRLSFVELRSEVARIAAWLRLIGVKPGDRIAAFAPNIPETLITMLATSTIGAVFSSCSPDFGTEAVIQRFSQIEPTVLLTADGYCYGGKTFDSLARAGEFSAQLPSIRHTLVAAYVQAHPSLGGLVNPTAWHDIERSGDTIDFEQLPFDHPLYILYSSGTTGIPKCIIHGAGGTLLQHLKEHVLHTDLAIRRTPHDTSHRRDDSATAPSGQTTKTPDPLDRLFYFTTCGWMMWNWLVSGLAGGTTIVLYDGSPFYPDGNILFDMCDAESVSVFGTSASYIGALAKENLSPAKTHRLTSLRTVLSTGSPLSPDGFDYVYRNVKRDICLSSISGGTDIVSCFALGNPIAPVWRGQLQCRGLGMHVQVFDDNGRALVAEKGELVCTRPFPSMPIRFWNDPDGKKYRCAYFAKFANVWQHGDFAEITPEGGMIIYGRSDAVLNAGGVRIGTAEIYRQANVIPDVVDSVAIAQQWQADTRIVLFVRLREGVTLDDNLTVQIKTAIRTGASPRHVPARIIQVPDIPRTRSGKIVELAVREVVHDRPVDNEQALANPQSLEFFRNCLELEE